MVPARAAMMHVLECRCGQPVYFDNLTCVHCGRALAFDPHAMRMTSETEPGAGLDTCSNRDSESRCNWLSGSPGAVAPCLSCAMTQMIPALSKPENGPRWRRLEAAKRRLVSELLVLGLPVDASRLRFVFKEDRRTNPHVHEEHVTTGHESGTITINAAEADDVFREQMRELMNEPVRTLLGHFRHESGHHYFDVLLDAARLDRARSLFGDERSDYGTALERYYRDGPPGDWRERFISAYASAHPAEDWAECWAHYLKMRALLDVVSVRREPHDPGEDWLAWFVDITIDLNEMMRSLGLPDAYPFVITEPVADKIRFIHDTVTAAGGDAA